MKPLKDLNLMDRFLFAEAMENPIVNQAVLSVIMGEEIHLQEKAQTEPVLSGIGRLFPFGTGIGGF